MPRRFPLLVLCLAGCDRPEPRAPAADTMMHADPAPPAAAPALPRAPAGPAPRFEDFAVRDTSFRGRPAPVRLTSAEYGRMYRTKLREGAAAGPNFAGHYTLVYWGCGTGCQVVAVVDARTGVLSRRTLGTMSGILFRRDSRLLVADPVDPNVEPPPPECASCGPTAYYEWRGGDFAPVGPGPHPHLGGARPWRTVPDGAGGFR